MHDATFVLSTGRCGTQWLASALAEHYSDGIRVEHEPLHNRYQARKALAYSKDRKSSIPQEVVRHVDSIEATIETMPYIECGHPCWSTIPYLVDRLGSRIRIIHLTRHPVPTSYSWLTQCAYRPPLAPHLPEKVLLSPFDEGIRFHEYRDTWDTLTPFEKCLFYWAEVNAFALELQNRLDRCWLRLRYEDLFNGDGLAKLIEFLGLSLNDEILQRRTQSIDAFRFVIAEGQNLQLVEHHPQAIMVMEKLGYDLELLDTDRLASRYLQDEK